MGYGDFLVDASKESNCRSLSPFNDLRSGVLAQSNNKMYQKSYLCKLILYYASSQEFGLCRY